MKDALVILSGGQDSTTCLFWAINQGYKCSTITFDYNQLHNIEIQSAEKISKLAKVMDHELIDLGPLFHGDSPLTNKAKNLEVHDDIGKFKKGIQDTFVPARNLLFLSIAANRAYSKNIPTLITGVCQEDFGGYPDCRREFIDSLEKSISLALDKRINILTPLMNLQKSQIVDLARKLPDPSWRALSYTHTSYDGQYPPSSNDHANLLRAKGFEEAGLPDPLILRAVNENLMELPKTKNYEIKS